MIETFEFCDRNSCLHIMDARIIKFDLIYYYIAAWQLDWDIVQYINY